MAVLLLRQTWVNLVSSGEGLAAWSARGRTWSASQDGEVRRYAGGRFRSIATEGTRQLQVVTLRDVSQANVERLKTWLGEAIIVRDTRARKMYGVFFDLAISDKIDSTYYDVALTIEEVTFQEGA